MVVAALNSALFASAPSMGAGSIVSSVLDDAKSRAAQLSTKSVAAESVGDKAESLKQTAQAEINKGISKAQAAAPGGSGGKIELYSGKYYAACTLGGILACGTTHALVTPLDLVKCRKQVNKDLYKGNMDGWSKIWKSEGGLRGI